MPRRTITDLDQALSEAAAGRRVLLRRGGQRLALVSEEDLARLEAWDAEEDADLLAAAEAAEAEAEDRGETPQPFDLARYRPGT